MQSIQHEMLSASCAGGIVQRQSKVKHMATAQAEMHLKYAVAWTQACKARVEGWGGGVGGGAPAGM